MWRMKVDAAGEEDWKSSSSQPLFDGFKMIMSDPINWILVLIVYGAASSISINSFFPTIVSSLGKDRITTLLLTSPPYLTSTGVGPRYLGAMIMLPGIYTGFNMSMVWTANTIYRPTTKRAAAVAFNNAVSTVSSIYGSYLYPNNAAPRFVVAFGVNAGMAFLAIVASTVLHFVLKRENRKLILKEQEAEADGRTRIIGKGFRYLI
ncbi:pantothenate transporter liz1 [Colletotrichum tofieldiae]|nr:pantothenate transporter liz1 [Colletotrichum tofieldiae]